MSKQHRPDGPRIVTPPVRRGPFVWRTFKDEMPPTGEPILFKDKHNLFPMSDFIVAGYLKEYGLGPAKALILYDQTNKLIFNFQGEMTPDYLWCSVPRDWVLFWEGK